MVVEGLGKDLQAKIALPAGPCAFMPVKIEMPDTRIVE